MRAAPFLVLPGVAAAIAAGSLLTARPALAAPLFWDGTGTGWEATGSWSTSQTAATPDPAAVPGSVDVATFVATTATVAQTVNLNGVQSAQGLATNASNTFATTLLGGTGDQILSLGTSGINHVGGGLNIGSVTAGQQVAISLQGVQSWVSSAVGTGLGGLQVLNGVSIGAGGNQTLTLTGTNPSAAVSGAVSNGAATLSLTKAGTGTWTLSNANNTYTGATTVSAGTLRLSGSTSGNNIASSPGILIGNGATLDVNGLSSSGISTNGIVLASGQTITGTGATGSIVNGVVAVSAVTLNGNNTISNNAGGTLTTARLNVFNTNGTTNTITAGNIVSSITGGRGLIVGNGSAGTLTISGGSLTTSSTQPAGNGDLLGNGSGTGTLIISGGSYTNLSAAGLGFGFGGANPGAGVLTLTSGSANINTFVFNASTIGGATVNLDGGTLTLAAITNTGGNRTINFNGGLLQASGNLNIVATGLAADSVRVGNGGAIIDTQANTVTIGSNLLRLSGSTTDSLTKSGSGTLVLSGANTFAGGVVINAGRLQVGSAGALNSTAGLQNAVAFGAGSTGALTLNGNSVVIGNLSSNAAPGTPVVENASAAPVTLTVGNAVNASGAFAGVIQDGAGGGALSLTKAGTGTLNLTGANTYTGATTVSAGTLANNGVINGSTAVNAGATLRGSGIFNGPVSNAGTHLVGNSPGRQVMNAGYSNSSLLIFEVNGITNNVFAAVPGTATDPASIRNAAAGYFNANGEPTAGANGYNNSLTPGSLDPASAGAGVYVHSSMEVGVGNFVNVTGSGTLRVDFTPAALLALKLGDVFDLLDVDNATSGFGAGIFVGNGDETSSGFDFPNISATGLAFDTNLFLSQGLLVVVPEPSRTMLLCLAGAGMLVKRRRTRR